MATQVLSQDEIMLNSVRYKLAGDGQIHPFLTGGLAQKQVLGDYSMDSDPDRSIWVVVGDNRNGIGLETFRKKEDVGRLWFTTANHDYPGHSFLPRLASTATLPTITATNEANLDMETWSDANTPGTWTEDQAWTRSASAQAGSYAATVTFSGTDWTIAGHQHITWSTEYRNRVCHLRGWGRSSNNWSAADYGVKFAIYDGVDRTFSGVAGNDAANTYEQSTWASHVVDPAATELTLEVWVKDNGSGYAYLWDSLEFKPPNTGTVQHWCEFGSNLLVAQGNNLYVLNKGTGAAFLYWYSFPATITNLYATSVSALMIELGDSTNYWFAIQGTSSATLAEDLDNSETGVDVSDGTQFVVGCTIKIDSEEMLVTNISTNTLTVVRGTLGSTAATHTSGASITTTRFYEATGTAANAKNAQVGVHWDYKPFKMNSSGQLYYIADLNDTTPSWTANGLLDTTRYGSVNHLVTYCDANGNDIIYAGTTRGLWAHDYANGLWENTELQVPQHADNAKGLIVCNGSLYYSSGLDVWEYPFPGQGLPIRNVGLGRDDGLPDEYMGSIVHMFGGYGGEFYALTDPDTVSASNYAGLYRYKDGAWHPQWVDSSAGTTPHGGIVSSVYAYRRWWDADNTVYYQELDRARRNPLKVAASTYAASAFDVSPWFDAQWLRDNKCAIRLIISAKGITSTETIVAKYRINMTTTALASTWTTLVTLSGSTAAWSGWESNNGTNFKFIQFRFDYARGGTNTLTPNINYALLEFDRATPAKWGWVFKVDLTQPYDNKSPSQLLSAIQTAANTGTLLGFYYKDVVKYVRVRSVEGEQITGNGEKGIYTVTVVEK